MGGVTQEGMPPTASAEIFDPETRQWTFTGTMNTGREDHAAVLLRDGRVLVAGGTMSEESPRIASGEIFDPETGTWTLLKSMMSLGRSEIEYAAVPLHSGGSAGAHNGQRGLEGCNRRQRSANLHRRTLSTLSNRPGRGALRVGGDQRVQRRLSADEPRGKFCSKCQRVV